MKKWKSFNVVGVHFKNKPTDKLTRLEMISKYCGFGSKFELVREFDNPYDENAIQVRQVFKSGGWVQVGYVPKALAEKWVLNWAEVSKRPLKFGMKYIDEKTGDCKGLQIRYEKEEV